MKYRVLFRRRRKPSTSKRLKRMSSTSVPVVESGRPIVLRGSPTAPPSPTAAKSVAPPPARDPLERRFRIEAVVGEEDGVRMAAVIERRTARRLTLTTFALAGARDWDAWERFRHECEVLRSLHHPGVPRWVEHAELDAIAYLLTERVEGRSLATRMERDERWSDAKLQHILARALVVLGDLHELNPPVLHTDVHPGALFVSDQGHVTLVGFGRSRSRLATDDIDPVGRDGYCPPWDEPIGPALDLYQLGATIAAVATGRDAALLPRKDGAIDLDACMRVSGVREQVRGLLARDPQWRVTTARRLRRPPTR